MDDLTPQQKQQHFASLPIAVREAISDSSTYEMIEKIAYTHGLNNVEAGLLAQPTSMLMMGYTKPNDYISSILEQLAISRDQAMLIAQDINRDIFTTIKEDLKEVHSRGGFKAPVVSSESAPVVTAPAVAPSAAPTISPLQPKITPTPVPPTATREPLPSGTALEQKMSGAFRMKGDSAIQPPTAAAKNPDPYREAPLP